MSRIAAVVLLLSLTRPAPGDFITETSTVGYQLANAKCVVRGAVAKVETLDLPASELRNGHPCLKVTIDVRETLIGPASATLVAVDDSGLGGKWALKITEQLFFFRSPAPQAKTVPSLANAYWYEPWGFLGPTSADLDAKSLTDNGDRWLTDDLRRLRTPAELLDEVRRVALMMPAGTAMIELPDDVKKPLGITEQFLNVALTDETFANARKWVRSEDPTMRWCGVEVLLHKNSKENAEALQHFAETMPPVDWYPRRIVRARVLCTLHSWGARGVPLVRSVPAFDVASFSSWFWSGAVLILPVCYLGWKRRRARVTVSLWLTAMAGLAVVDIRSFHPRDALTWGRYDIAAERGNLYIARQTRADSGLPSPLIVCQPEELLGWHNVEYELSGRYTTLNDWSDSLFPPPRSFADLFEPDWPFHTAGNISWSQRLRLPVWKVPIWAILIFIVLPWTAVYARKWYLLRRTRRARGFPVVGPA